MLAGVLVLTGASAYANYIHVSSHGASIIGLVIGAEIIKFGAPLAMAEHAERGHGTRFVMTLVLWAFVVVFSFTNTFGNALKKHSIEQARIETEKANSTRPEHVVLKEIAQLPACGKRGCTKQQVDKRTALEAEVKLARKNGTHTAVVKDDAIRDGFVMLAASAGHEMNPDRVFVTISLIWTLLAEIGSALGGLAIPAIRRKD